MGRGVRQAIMQQPMSARVVLPNRTQSQALYQWKDAETGLRTICTEFDDQREPGDNHVFTKGTIVNTTDTVVGKWVREMRVETLEDGCQRLVAYNTLITIENLFYHHTGFGRRWNKELNTRYQKRGVHRVEFEAGLLGRYVWATMDGSRFNTNYPDPPDAFEPSDLKLREARVAQNLWHGFQYDVQDARYEPHITAQHCQEAESFFLNDDRLHEDTIVYPQQVVALGREHAWKQENGESMWLGKAILLSEGNDLGWRGWLALQ